MRICTSILLILLFMDFGSSIPQPKDFDGNISSTQKNTGAKRARGPYMGARLRGGKWVSEIRVPNTKIRIWLGSHDSAEAAAQAYDDASYFVHGPEGPCNFPNRKRPQCSNQPIGSKTGKEILQIVEESTPADSGKVPVRKKQRSKLSATRSSVDKSVLQDQLAPVEDPAPKVNSEPVVHSAPEVERCVPEQQFTSDASEMEPYIPSFAPEEPTFPCGDLPFDEAFIKESNDWILDFMADPKYQ